MRLLFHDRDPLLLSTFAHGMRLWTSSGAPGEVPAGLSRKDGAGGRLSDLEDADDLMEGLDEDVDVLLVVVNVKAGPDGVVHPEPIHQGLGAVVAGPDGDAVLVQDVGHVVGVSLLEGKRDDTQPGALVGTV